MAAESGDPTEIESPLHKASPNVPSFYRALSSQPSTHIPSPDPPTTLHTLGTYIAFIPLSLFTFPAELATDCKSRLTQDSSSHLDSGTGVRYRTSLSSRKEHGQKDDSEPDSGILVSKKMGNEVELPFLENYSLKNTHFSSGYTLKVLKDKQEQSQSKVNGRRLKPPELFALPSYEPELHPRSGYVGGK
ncbi:hypothetical protein MJG53_018225 [Ovis ammon polii x Ovis aries]|uniref:Uncharacterized protein n=1 Tax=Ovis ammon polii x Ovis aries TaxID=2918886 RepID=A0ACB9U6J2_9CETA|nr:hypothetical protein MJG53_018225 [Ovis ammon polii x Ovis aries]